MIICIDFNLVKNNKKLKFSLIFKIKILKFEE